MARVPSSLASMASTVRAYALPLILFAGAMFYQLVLIPNSFPTSHYDVLQIERYNSVEKVKEAYDKLESKWNSAVEVSDTHEFLKIRYAYELLTNPLWKRDYDIFGIDEQLNIVESASKRYAGKLISQLDFPLLHAPSSDSIDYSSKVITASDFQSIFPDAKPWLIQGANVVLSFLSPGRRLGKKIPFLKVAERSYEKYASLCHNKGIKLVVSGVFSDSSAPPSHWKGSLDKMKASLLDAVANIGMVELGEMELAIYLADKKSTGKPFFRNGIPSLVAIPPGCRAAKCFSRFDGELSVDNVTNWDGELAVDKVINWFATTILALPQINYYTKESLVPNFFGKSSHHKVKVIFFSKTGERAAPFIRQAAKDYWAYASFAFILWREEESSYWWGAFGAESAPAIVFLKDPGVKPVVHHGSVNNSFFLNMMENNKEQELPQLRSVTSMELGCDPHGYSRAGYDTIIWYCAIAVGRPSLELNKMRETMCRVQETLSKHSEVDASSENQSLTPAVDAFKRKRLTFAWLDGEKQKDYCQFYLGNAGSEDTCGPRRGVTDMPKLYVIRYLRNSSAVDTRTQEMTKWKSILVQDIINDSDQAGQFVAGYKGAADIPEIIHWLASIIADGDSRDLPFFTLRTPKLVPDDAEPIWSKTAQKIPSKYLKQSILGAVSGLSVYLEDPRIGPFLLLGALISMGTIWLRRSQQVQLSKSKQPTQPSSEAPSKNERKQKPRDRVRSRSNKNQPPSMTDFDPPDAYQMPLSDSESE